MVFDLGYLIQKDGALTERGSGRDFTIGTNLVGTLLSHMSVPHGGGEGGGRSGGRDTLS